MAVQSLAMRAFLDEDRWSAWAADVSALVEGLQKVKDDLERRASAEVERNLKVQKTLGMRFVTPDARMAVMEIKWGLVPDMAGIALLRRLIRDDQARELTYSGRQFTGEEALSLGLATRVCADPYAEALAFARDVASKNPDAIRADKRLMNLADDGDQRAILLAESVEQSALIGSPNQIEAVLSSMQKRAPKVVT